jgi:hypothetical protein
MGDDNLVENVVVGRMMLKTTKKRRLLGGNDAPRRSGISIDGYEKAK